MRYVFLSASVPTGKKRYPGWQRHHRSARPVLIREAVLAIARVGLRAGYGFVFGAHPSISPMILTVAREFPSRRPRIHVFQSRLFVDAYPRETLELADGVLGALHETRAVPSRRPDRERSLAEMREQMLATRGLAAAVYVGGMDGILDEARMFREWHGDRLPAYAIASPGGAARDLLAPSPDRRDTAQHAGGAIAPVRQALLADPVAGYTRVARAIFAAIGSTHRGR